MKETLIKRLGVNSELINLILENNTLKDTKDLKVTIPLNMKKYKNKISSYSEVMKEYFSDFDIFVLTKTKAQSRLNYFLPFKKKDNQKINTISPSFLVKKQNIKLLINYKEENILEITELKKVKEQEFIIDNVKYKKKNQIKLK